MHCPFCDTPDSAVVDSRLLSGGSQIRRRRFCSACGSRFTTYEKIERAMPLVIKRDLTRQPFDEAKLRRGLEHALLRRPVSADKIDQLINEVMNLARTNGAREVESRQIGEWVMERLPKLDQVAYVRFASVYRAFQSLEDFNQEVKHLKKVLDKMP